ncbi:MAG: prepilin-type N-terminal cleavage/methylation domain-containing protein [Rubripirellula sp.]
MMNNRKTEMHRYCLARPAESLRSRAALTLVELMVALAVISVLAGIALPTVKSTIQGQKLSRAATLLQSAIEEGRARSIATGGGGGIIIDRSGIENINQRCDSTRVRFATVSPPYTGDTPGSTVKIGVANGAFVRNDVISIWFDPTSIQARRAVDDILAEQADPTLTVRTKPINPGDFIQLDNGGLMLRATDVMRYGTVAFRDAAGITAAQLSDVDVVNWVWIEVERLEPQLNLRRFVGQDVSFQVNRSPRPAISMPVDLPRGTAIDLTSSGIGRFGSQFSPMFIDGNYIDTTLAPFVGTPRDYQSIYVLFGRRGEVARVLGGVLVGGVVELLEIPVTGDIFFLVGEGGEIKPEDPLEDADRNPLEDAKKDGRTPLLDSSSIWVSIKARSGEVIASPWIDPTDSTSNLIGGAPTVSTNATQKKRIEDVLGRTRSAAVEVREDGI